MDILAPLNNMDTLPRLTDAGVTEFYFGFSDPQWSAQFGETSGINRMSNFGARANILTVSQVPAAIAAIHHHGAKGYVALNAPQYSTQQSKVLEQYLDLLTQQKPDGVIVSGVQEARLVLQKNLVPVASTMCGIYNQDIAQFYQDIGVTRMIFPREITLKEMEVMIEKCPQVQFEAFFMRNGCMFSDTSCLGIHSRQHGSLCASLCGTQTLIQGDRRDFATVHKAEETSILYHNYYRHSTCGMCALYRLMQLGIHSLKIVGRADHPEAIEKDARLIGENMKIAQGAHSEQAYLSSMKFPENRFYLCKNGFSCYYPEVRFS